MRPIAMDDVIPPEVALSLSGLFRERVRRTPSAVAYREFDAGSQQWVAHSWQDMDCRVARARAALLAAGLKSGDPAAIVKPNGTTWVSVDIAALSLGLVVVPLYLHDSAANMAFVLAHSDARVLIADTQARWHSLQPHRSALGNVEHARGNRRALGHEWWIRWPGPGREREGNAAADPRGAVRPRRDR